MPSPTRTAFGAACALVFAAGTSKATPSARLVYSRDSRANTCPDEAALRRAVAALVGYDAFFPRAERAILANLTRRDEGFVATVDLVDEHGIRHGGHELRTTGQCVELLDAVALSVAIAIDPQLALAPSPAPPPPPPAPAEPTPTADASIASDVIALAPPTPAPRESKALSGTRPASALSFYASAGAAGAIGLAPEPSFGGTLGGVVRWRWLSLGLEAFVAAPIQRPAGGGGSVASWPLLGTVAPCAHVGPLFGCGLIQGGSVFSSGEGVSGARSSSSTWWALGGRVGVVLPLRGPIQLRAHLDVLGDLSRDVLVFNGQDQWMAPPVSGAIGIDALVRFP